MSTEDSVPLAHVKEFLAALDEVFRIEERKTWSGGYKVFTGIGERLLAWQHMRELRERMVPTVPAVPPVQVDADALQSALCALRAAGDADIARKLEESMKPTEGKA